MLVKDFVADFKAKNIMNTKISPNAVEDYIVKTLEIKEYVPFLTKKKIVETVVRDNITVVDGIKKSNSINQYVSFVIAMLVSHTNLEIEEPFSDYDALCESNLLASIINTFKEDYDTCDILLKMTLASEMEDNNINVLIGNFLNRIGENLGDFSEVLKEKLSDLNLDSILDGSINKENITNLLGILNK